MKLEPVQSESPIETRSFKRAALSSESYRIFWLLWLLGALALGVSFRNFAAGQFRLLYLQLAVLLLAVAYEGFALVKVKKALRTEHELSPAIWVMNVLVEAALPTLGLFTLIQSRFLEPYQGLVAPAVFLYFLFIILSTLRLSPPLSLLSGCASALGYLLVTFYVHQQFPLMATRTFAIPPTYFIYAGLIVTGGIAAAVVASQIRGHVYAALREAELQRELERVNHDLDIARSIQQGLLPNRAPGLAGFELAGWNQPADQTGGDYFDWQTLPDGRLAISLGDATGHGIGPALVMASCRAYARASLLAGNHNDGVLNILNQLLAEDLPANRFVTYVVVLLDPANAHVEVLSAGHGPIIWYRYATDKIENLEAQGIPLGMMAGAKYERGTEVRLEAGDTLALITDGFYEWTNPEGEEFGLVRLEAVIREARDCKPEEVIARLRSAVETFCRGTKQQDDLTAVLLRRNVS
ncbi:MAG TPA: PP2C family protein-serine/threonine phosphatase [Pyrinomonadaceae bacterium]|jgi:serine phosphatase RsbU (regulator of sigma subunit)